MATKKIEKKMKEKGAVKSRNSFPPKFVTEVIDVHLLQTEAYICSEKGKLQNNMKQHNYSEGRMEKNQNGVVYTQKQEQTISLCTVIFVMIAKIRYDSEISL